MDWKTVSFTFAFFKGSRNHIQESELCLDCVWMVQPPCWYSKFLVWKAYGCIFYLNATSTNRIWTKATSKRNANRTRIPTIKQTFKYVEVQIWLLSLLNRVLFQCSSIHIDTTPVERIGPEIELIIQVERPEIRKPCHRWSLVVNVVDANEDNHICRWKLIIVMSYAVTMFPRLSMTKVSCWMVYWTQPR